MFSNLSDIFSPKRYLNLLCKLFVCEFVISRGFSSLTIMEKSFIAVIFVVATIDMMTDLIEWYIKN
jgi:hypothetical protein